MISIVSELGLHLAVLLSIASIAYWYIDSLDTTTRGFIKKRPSKTETTLKELYVQIPPELFFLLRVGFSVIAFLTGSAVHFLFGVMLVVVAWVLPLFILESLKRKRVAQIELQLVQGLELLGNSLKSGLTLPQAIELLVKEFPAPISQEFSLVLSECRVGVELTAALKNMADRLGSTIVGILATGVAITKRSGGDMAVIFTTIATTIREQANIEGKLKAVTAQGRFQGMVLGLMPFGLIVILWFADRSHVQTLFAYTLGQWAFSAVIVMVILAQIWIRKLLAIDV